MENKTVILDGIVKTDGGYGFSIVASEAEDAQYWKDIIRQVLEQCGLVVEIKTCMYDTKEMKQLCVV